MMDDFEWTVLYEGRLLDAMHGHKPVGVNKYFQMAFICDKFSEAMNKDVNSEKIWAHLGTMYNLEALDESESIPFPNNEKDFCLPEGDFGNLIVIKIEEEKKVATSKGGRETPRQTKEMKIEDKPNKSNKESQRRDSKDSKDSSKSTSSVKKEPKKDNDKPKATKSRNSSMSKDDSKKHKNDETKQAKRPTRASLKPDDSSSSGKSSPLTVAPHNSKRRRNT